MLLHRTEKKATAETHKQFKNLPLYIRYIVNIYSAAEIKRELWLTEREKDFFVATVIVVLNGITDPISDEAVQIYKNFFYNKTGKAKISDYINRITNKNWAVYDKRYRKITLPSLFYGIDVKEDMIDFILRFAYETDRPDLEQDN